MRKVGAGKIIRITCILSEPQAQLEDSAIAKSVSKFPKEHDTEPSIESSEAEELVEEIVKKSLFLRKIIPSVKEVLPPLLKIRK